MPAANERLGQVAIVSGQVASSNIRAGQIAIIAPSVGRAANIRLGQVVMIAVELELPFAKRLVPIGLPGYTFSGIPFYHKGN